VFSLRIVCVFSSSVLHFSRVNRRVWHCVAWLCWCVWWAWRRTCCWCWCLWCRV